jgi:hypothetical protein
MMVLRWEVKEMLVTLPPSVLRKFLLIGIKGNEYFENIENIIYGNLSTIYKYYKS